MKYTSFTKDNDKHSNEDESLIMSNQRNYRNKKNKLLSRINKSYSTVNTDLNNDK